MFSTLFAILAGLKGAGGIIAGAGALTGVAAPFFRAHWKLFALGALALIVIGGLWAFHVSGLRQAHEAERLICTMEKKQSREDADAIDRDASDQALSNHMADLEAANALVLKAQAEAREDENAIAQLAPALRACRAATDDDIRRLLR